MKTRKTLTILLAALAMTACKYDDTDLWEQVNQNTEDIAAQAERIAALEAWQAETNTNIQSLRTLLSTTDYITAVTPVTENGVEVGYTISFLNTPAITIYHGEKGDKGDTGAQGEQGEQGIQGEQGEQGAAGSTPQISVTQGEDGNWYWTLNGALLTDDQGNPIRANGTQGDKGDTGTSAPLPSLSTGAKLTDIPTDTQNNPIDPEAIYLSVDGGKTWTRVSGPQGEQGNQGNPGTPGDSFFSSKPIITDTKVTFTLKDGTQFSLPLYTGLKLNFGEQTAISLLYGASREITFTAEGSAAFTTDNLFIIAPDGWKADIAQGNSGDTSTDFTLTVTAPADEASGAAEGEILVMLNDGLGNTTIGRLEVTVDKYKTDGTALTAAALRPGELAVILGEHPEITSITVTSGTIDETDRTAIWSLANQLTAFDLAAATYTGTGVWQYFSKFLCLQTAKLPKGITTLKVGAFHGCTSLKTVTLPEGLGSIGDGAFQSCSSLETITLPEGLESIGINAFQECRSLETITLPKELGSIGIGAFYNCSSLKTVTCLATTPPVLGISAFYSVPNALTDIYVPAEAVEAYKATTNWSNYAGIISAIQQ